MQRRLLWSAAVIAICVVALVLHVQLYGLFIADDAFISLRYSNRLLQGHGLTWTEGPRVEGYSNLLYVLVMALYAKLGGDLVSGVKVVGYACTIATMLVLVCAFPARGPRSAVPSLVGGLVLALGGPTAVWTIAGLEQTLLGFLLAGALATLFPKLQGAAPPFRAWLVPGLFLALLCWTRPDGPLYTVCAAAALVLARRGDGRALVRHGAALVLLPVAFTLGQLAFRLAYYGEWVPNTARAKLSFSQTHVEWGIDYLVQGFTTQGPVAALAALSIVACFARKHRRREILCVALPFLAWMAYLVSIGGDHFPGRRHFVPLMVMLAFFAALGADWAARRLRVGAFGGVCAFLALAMALQVHFQRAEEEKAQVQRITWVWAGQVVAETLRGLFADSRPLLAVDAAGCLPFWSELPCIDMLGLNDDYLPLHPPESFGTQRLGHELGDGEYVFGRRPDLIAFGTPPHRLQAPFISGKEMQALPEFEREYTFNTFEGTEPFWTQAVLWIRKESERIGVARSAQRIEVPGYLFRGERDAYRGSARRNKAPRPTVVRAGPTGSPLTHVRGDVPVALDDLQLPVGRWRIELAGASNGRFEASVRDTQERSVVEGELPLTLEVADTTLVRVALSSIDGAPARLDSLVFVALDTPR